MRGSVWVELEVWIVNKRGGRYANSSDTAYGYSKVRDLNNKIQREENFHFAVNNAIKIYRVNHKIDSDTELNYHLVGSGINTVTLRDGYTKDKWRDVRITPSRKRAIHQQVFLGKDKPLSKKELLDTKGEDITITEYKEGKMKKEKLHRQKLDTNNYIIETGNLKKKRKSK